MLQSAIMQLINDVAWNYLDYLIIDFPPGTGDTQLTIMQKIQIDHALIVTTPQDVALLDSRKSITFANSLKVNVIGVIENMSGYTVRGKAPAGADIQLAAPGGKTIRVTADEDGNWSGTLDIFKSGGGEKTAEEFGVPFLGKLPFDPGFVRGGDDGVHRIVSEPEGPSSEAFAEVVAQIQSKVESGSLAGGLEII